MTFPAALFVTENIYTAIFGLFVSFILALKKCSLTVVAMSSCVAVFILDFILNLL